ncbi:hypothetical protein J6A64_06545 [bacterium]|nr:hypothetical protein [bacterium]MBO5446528.1 hypothetical protein [bacterium]
MKRFLFALIMIVSMAFTPSVFADDVDLPASGDLWDNWGTSQDFYGQDKKGVSDEEFDKAIEQVKDKQSRGLFGRKKRNKNIPKGEEFSQSNESEILDVQVDKDALPVVSLPVELVVGDGVLPVGHYQIQGERKEDKVYLKFYQAHNLFAEFPAVETQDDFGEEEILFARWFPEGENKIKIIYGSLDFNAYTFVQIKE